MINFTASDVYRQSLMGRNMVSARVLPPVRPLHCAAPREYFIHQCRIRRNVIRTYENIRIRIRKIRFTENYPSLSVLYDRIFRRQQNDFLPDEQRRNLLFQTYYQYFVLQFFDADFNPSVCLCRAIEYIVFSVLLNHCKLSMLRKFAYIGICFSTIRSKQVYPEKVEIVCWWKTENRIL